MGGSSYSDDLYKSRATTRAAMNTPVFAHTAAVKAGAVARACHAKLNPFGVTRESRDSAVHPESLAIGIGFDETGSMGTIPAKMQAKLSTLMALLISKGYVQHPQILFAAIGDANTGGSNHDEVAPLQVGQFESGLEMEDDMTLFYLEGNGGGQNKETYELLHYFFLKHTVTDCFEKRGQKGYLFTIGDEAPYDIITKSNVERLMGDTLEADLLTKDVFKALEERWNVFHVIAEQGAYPHNPVIEKAWRDLLGERVLLMEDYNNVAELIASTIGVCEGTDLADIRAHLADVGTSAAAIASVTSALIPLSQVTAVAKAGTVGGVMPPVAEPVGAGVERL